MGRRSGGGGGGSRSSAPRPAAPAPKPAAAKPASASTPDKKNSSASPPDKKSSAPVPDKKSPAPAPAPAQSSFLGSVTDGFGLAVGMSMAHSLLGGRTVDESPLPASPAAADADACGIHNQDFTNCIYTNASDISQCQIYFDLLYQCRRGGGAGAEEASTIA